MFDSIDDVLSLVVPICVKVHGKQHCHMELLIAILPQGLFNKKCSAVVVTHPVQEGAWESADLILSTFGSAWPFGKFRKV